MDPSDEELTTWSGGGRKRKLSLETAEPSDHSGVPQVTVTPSDQVLGSSSASTVAPIGPKKRTQELPSASLTNPSNRNGNRRSRPSSLDVHDSTRRGDALRAHTLGSEGEGSRKYLLYPNTIDYELQVQFDGQTIRDLHGLVGLNDADGYLNIEKRADSFVRERCKEPRDAYYIHFRGGHCIETRDNEERPQLAISNQMQWRSTCHKLTKDFVDGQLEHCTLLISREYSLLELQPTDTDNDDKDKYEDAFVINKACELCPLLKTNLNGKEYLPKIDFDGFTSQPVIRAVINHSNRLKYLTEVQREELVEEIDLGARKLFTAFILNRYTMHCFNRLLKGGYHDDNLPKHHQEEPYACCRYHNDQYNTLGETISVFSAFSFKAQGHFVLERNCVVPILPVAVDQSRRSSDLSTDPTNALNEGEDNSPTEKEIRKSRARLGEGAHARVYQVRIDPAHNEITSNRDELFALKEFRHSRSNAEETMLNRIESYDKPHLTKRLVSWTQGNDRWILFPLAEYNLADYMDRLVFSGEEGETFWLLEQFIGLADALIFIHTLPCDVLPGDGHQQLSPLTMGTYDVRPKSSGIGWHHDVKPRNILYFINAETQERCFQLCDYESSKVNAFRSRSDPTSTWRGTPTYEPPETDDGSLSRPSDTWALGCVFLVTVTWALLGSAGVEKFREDRMGTRFRDSYKRDDAFWEKLPEKTLRLREAVQDQLTLLQKKARESRHTLFSVALDVISHMLCVDKDKRIKMEDVSKQLQKEVGQAKGVLEQNKAASITDQALHLSPTASHVPF